ncbi:hypothetical protein DVH05_015797 [Phytophthora capsici]|nr:hypothetical protein DVH05_015797 [Phytophthora capsici]
MGKPLDGEPLDTGPPSDVRSEVPVDGSGPREDTREDGLNQANNDVEDSSKETAVQITQDKPEGNHSYPALPVDKGKQLTWSDRVRGTGTDPNRAIEDDITRSRMLSGIWNPLHEKQLKETILADWSKTTHREWIEQEREHRAVALAPAKACRDGNIRQWTEAENDALVAYLGGTLDLPHPPNFIKEIMSHEQRALLEDYHEAHFNATITANLPPTVRLPRFVPHADLFKEFFQANTDKRFGTDMMRIFQEDVKRLEYDGLHTISLVFYSRTAADRWERKALRFQRAVIVLNDTISTRGREGEYTLAQVELQYAIRVYGADNMGLTMLTRVMEQVIGTEVLDVEFARATKTDIYDNRYCTITFAQMGCPTAIVDVTRTEIEDQVLTVHHFQTQQRRPCSRCYSPHHGRRKCVVSAERLSKTQCRYGRVHTWTSGDRDTVPRDFYQVDSIESLLGAMKKLPERIVNAPHALLRREVQAPSEANFKQPSRFTAAAPSIEGGAHQASIQTDDGYTVQLSKRSKQAHKKASQQQPKDAGSQAPSQQGSSKQKGNPNAKNAPIGTKPKGTQSGGVLTKAVVLAKEGQRATKRFNAFQRAEARGYHAELAAVEESEDEQEESDDDETCDDHQAEEAPYAYGASTSDTPADANVSTSNMDVDVHAHEPEAQVENMETYAPATHANAMHSVATTEERGPKRVAPGKPKPVKEQVKKQREANREATATTAKERRRQTRDINRAGLTQTSEVEESNSNNEQGHSTAHSSAEGEDDTVPATPSSQEEFTIARNAEGAPNGPVPVHLWLESFNGHEVEVAANGHCGFLALYATMNNHGTATMRNTAAIKKGANELKRVIYSKMMANLRTDVELNYVDPIAQCQVLFPSRPTPTSTEAATAELYAHYAGAREITVDTPVPVRFWVGTHELRTMAQYLREPLVVIDVTSATTANVQLYMYKTKRTATGKLHESGYVEALQDGKAVEYLETCWKLHVLPTFLVLHREEKHYYGVGHGELFVLWNAEGDPDYNAGLSDAYEWKRYINLVTKTKAQADMGTIDKLLDSNNQLIIKRMKQTDRLHVVHTRTGFPILNQDEMKRPTEDEVKREEVRIHEGYGVDAYAAGS